MRLAGGNSDISSLKLLLIIDRRVDKKRRKKSVFSLLLEVEINPVFFFHCLSGRSLLRLPWLRSHGTTPRGSFFSLNVNLLHTQALIHFESKPGPRCVSSLFTIIKDAQREPVENCILFSPESNFVRS